MFCDLENRTTSDEWVWDVLMESREVSFFRDKSERLEGMEWNDTIFSGIVGGVENSFISVMRFSAENEAIKQIMEVLASALMENIIDTPI